MDNILGFAVCHDAPSCSTVVSSSEQDEVNKETNSPIVDLPTRKYFYFK